MRMVRHWNRLPTVAMDCPIPESVQGQVRMGFWQTGLVEDDSAHGRGP